MKKIPVRKLEPFENDHIYVDHCLRYPDLVTKKGISDYHHFASNGLINYLGDEERIYRAEVLDVCCGIGTFAYMLKRMTKKYISDFDWNVKGIDSSIQAITLAKKNFPNVDFEIQDACSLNEPNEKYDIVTCIASLHHFPNPKDALTEMIRVTRPGGLMYIYDLARLDQTVIEALESFEQEGKILAPTYIDSIKASLTASEMELILNDVGFTDTKVFTRDLALNNFNHPLTEWYTVIHK